MKICWPVRPGAPLLACLILSGLAMPAVEQPAVRVAPTDSVGPRTLETQTRDAVVRDYLAAWQSLGRALNENNPSLLDADFTGIAREKLSGTVEDQQKLGLKTLYQDRKHNISLVFYSPEGLSIQLLDTVEYDLQVLDHDKLQATQHVRAQYLAVLTPTEVRWKVRIFQSVPK
jgi:hypothetical protein